MVPGASSLIAYSILIGTPNIKESYILLCPITVNLLYLKMSCGGN